MNSITTRNTNVYAKRHSFSSHYIYPFASAFVKGFYGFLKIFCFVFILEMVRYSLDIVERVNFDLIDILISFFGFIYYFFISLASGFLTEKKTW